MILSVSNEVAPESTSGTPDLLGECMTTWMCVDVSQYTYVNYNIEDGVDSTAQRAPKGGLIPELDWSRSDFIFEFGTRF